MNAQGIRKRQEIIEKVILKRNDSMNDAQGMGYGLCFWLSELALQFAEANEHLAKIANPPMVVENQEVVQCAFCNDPATITTQTCEKHQPQ